MKYLLDTNTCVVYLRQGPRSSISARLEQCDPADIALCSVVKAELLFGAFYSQRPEQNLAQVQLFTSQFPSLPFDDAAAEAYAPIRTTLWRAGTPIGPNDLFIAAIAIARNLVLVTHNTTEFSRVPGLQTEDWEA